MSVGNSVVKHPTLHHVNLKTLQVQKMIDWYTTVVGMQTVYEFPGGAWLTNDIANHRLALLPHCASGGIFHWHERVGDV